MVSLGGAMMAALQTNVPVARNLSRGLWDVGRGKGLTLMIGAFAEAMMQQAGLKGNARPVAPHVIIICSALSLTVRSFEGHNHVEFLSLLFYFFIYLHENYP